MNPAIARLRRRAPKLAWGRRGPVTVIEVEGSVLYLVQATRRGQGTEITRFAMETLDRPLALEPGDPASTGALVGQALDRLRVKPGPVAMSVPRGSVFLRNLVLPAPETAEELAAMVYLQIGKDLPFRADEAVIDFTVQPGSPALPLAETAVLDSTNGKSEAAPPTPKVEVLVAVVKKDTLQRYQQMAAAAGIKLASLGLASQANARGILACHAANGPGAVALVALRLHELTIDIIVDQTLVFSRTASIPAISVAPTPVTEPRPRNDETGNPEARTGSEPAERTPEIYLQAVAIEVIRSLHSFDGLGRQRPVESLLVAGQTGHEDEIVSALSQRLGIPSQRLDPVAALGLRPGKTGAGCGALTAVGLAFGLQDAQGLPLDFLQPKRPPTPRNWRRIKTVAAAAAGLLVLISLFGTRSLVMRQREQIRSQVQTQIALIEKNRPLFRDARLKSRTVQDWLVDRRDWLDPYAHLSAVLPPSPQVYVTSLSTGARGVIHLSLQARSGEILSQVDQQLRAAGYDVKPLAVTPGTDKFGYNFHSSLELGLPDKTNLDVSKLSVPARPEDDGSLETREPRAKPTPVGATSSLEGAGSRNSPAAASPAPKTEISEPPSQPAEAGPPTSPEGTEPRYRPGAGRPPNSGDNSESTPRRGRKNRP